MISVTNFAPPLDAACVGVSLKTQHFSHILETRPRVDFFEIHAENYMNDGGAHHRYLSKILEHYSLSVHGVGMSLGSAGGLSNTHMKRLRDVVERYKPRLVSEHLAWTKSDGIYLNDLLPLPLNEESYLIVKNNVCRLQDCLGRRILVENPSVYVSFDNSSIPEAEFLNRLASETKCGLLLDINNIFVSATNSGFDAHTYLSEIEIHQVGEVHLAGHVARQMEDGSQLLIDDHGSEVCDEVWDLYRDFCNRAGAVPTLVEWDNNIPVFSTLMEQSQMARDIQARSIEQRVKHAV